MTTRLGVIAFLFACVVCLRCTGFVLDDNCPFGSPCTCSGSFILCRELGLTMIPTVIRPPFRTYAGLDLRNNNISFVQAAAFRGLSVDTIDMSTNPITSMDGDAFFGLNTTWLILNNMSALTRLPESAGQLSLDSLDLRHTGITELQEDLLMGIGDTLKRLNIGFINITAWPSSLRHAVELETLTADGNVFASIPDDAFEAFNGSLRVLDLSHCGIMELPKAALKSLNSLEELRLDGNPFVSIPDDSFDSFKTSLIKLFLDGTGLTVVPPAVRRLSAIRELSFCAGAITGLPNDSFVGLNSTLRKLNLNGCHLSTVPHAIKVLNGLNVLDIASSGLERLNDDDFDGLSNLYVLWMGHNRVSALPAGYFNGLSSLRTLGVKDCGFSSFPSALNRLHLLETLLISDNNITAIPDHAMTGLISLRVLILNGNPLKSIAAHAFDGARSLYIVNLIGAKLAEVPKAVLNHPNLHSLDLQRNPIQCTCDNLLWLLGMNSQGSHLHLLVKGDCVNVNMDIQHYINIDLHRCSVVPVG